MSDEKKPVVAVTSENTCPWCNSAISKDLKECPNCKSLLFEEQKTVEDRLGKISEYNYGQVLLREREYLFSEIYQEKNLDKQIRFFALYSLIFSVVYGLLLGSFGGGLQILSSAVKLPLVLFGTMAVCLPALFTFNLLLGSKLSLKQTLSTLLVANYMLSTILVSLAPILFFFTLSTQDRAFFSILNIAFCITAGGFGIALLWRGMRFLTVKSGYEPIC